LVGVKWCLAYAFNRAAVPFRTKLALWTAVAEKVELPMTFARGAAWTAAAKARKVIEESMVPAVSDYWNERILRDWERDGNQVRGQPFGLISSSRGHHSDIVKT
jgi:hypothetical protein